METEIYYHYEFWKLKYVKIWDQKFISEDSLLEIVNKFDNKLRFEWWDIEEEIDNLILELKNMWCILY